MEHQHRSLEATLSAAFSNPAFQAVLDEHRSVSERLMEKTGLVTKGTTMRRRMFTNDLRSQTAGSSSVANQNTTKKASNLPVSNCDGSFYVTNVKIGGQSLPVMIDSGSSDLWVESSLCDETCKSSASSRYDASKSTTFKAVAANRSDCHLEYLDGTTIEGTHGYETLALGDIEIPNQVFAQASSTVNTTTVCNEVGLLGLGFSDISSQQFPALLSNLKDQGITMFSLYMTKHNDYKRLMNQTTHIEHPVPQQPPVSATSELTFGGVNPKHYTGCLGWHDLGQFRAKGETFKGYWDFALDGVFVGSNEVPSSSLAMVDSGSTITVGSQETIGRIAKKLGMQCFVMTDSVEGFEEVRCDDPFGYDLAATDCSLNWFMSPLTFKSDVKSYTLTSSELLREIDIDGSALCVLNLQGFPGFPGWLLGMNFLRKYYTVFDYGQKRLGFAEASTQSSTVCQADSSYFVGDIPDGATPVSPSSSPNHSPTHYNPTSNIRPTPHYSSSSSNNDDDVLGGFLYFSLILFVFFCRVAAIATPRTAHRAPTQTARVVRVVRVRTTDPEEGAANTNALELPAVT